MINRENLVKIGRAGGKTSNRETPDQIGMVGISAVHIYDFHIFTVIYSPLHGFIWNQLNNQRSTNWANKPTGNHFKGFTGLFGAILNTGSWIVSSVGRALLRNRKGHGFKSRTSDCEDRFHIRFFNRSSHIWFYSRFIISWLNSCRLV